MIFFILKVNVKWRLFDGIPFNEIPLGWLIIAKSRSETFRTTCVLFRRCFGWKKITTLLERQFKLKFKRRFQIEIRIDFLQWETWHELACNYWCVSVRFTYESVTSWLRFFIRVISRKFTFALEYSAVNFIVGW